MLRRVLLFKIMITLAFWAVPLTFFPPVVFALLGVPDPGSFLFMRLLGIAYFGLATGYLWGVMEIDAGCRVTGIVLMGIVSNGGALAVLAAFYFMGTFDSWGLLGKIYIAASCTALFTITALLAVSMIKDRK